MTEANCKTCHGALMAHLEGSLQGEAGERFDAHLSECPACRTDYVAFQDLAGELQSLGDAYANSVSEIDLLEAVLGDVAALKAGALTLPEIAVLPDPLLIASILGELGDLDAARLKRRLENDPELLAEFKPLLEMDEDLKALAEAEHVPSVDLVEQVLARLQALGAPPESLAHFFALRQIERDLEAVGDQWNAQCPAVDLVASVLKAIEAPAPPNIVPLRTRRKPEVQAQPAVSPFKRLSGLAAALILLTAAFLAFQTWRGATTNAPELRVAENIAPPPPRLAAERRAWNTGQGKHAEAFRALAPLRQANDATEVATEPEAVKESSRPTTLQEVLNAQRDAMMKNADALTRLGNWATLAPDEARALLLDTGLSPEALLGASQFLPASEALAVLERLTEQFPENPYLRYALAKNYGEEGSYGESVGQLAAWSALEPDNAMPHYMEAGVLMRQGYVEEALSALDSGSHFEQASLYPRETALQREQAMLAQGVTPDIARILAATSAARGEYETLTAYAQELLQYGDYYASIGDFATAEQIYKATQQMGALVQQSALFAYEELAGIDSQYQAVIALESLYQLFEQPQNLQILGDTLGGILSSFTQVGAFFSTYANLYANLSAAQITEFAQEVLMNGDLLGYPTFLPNP